MSSDQIARFRAAYTRSGLAETELRADPVEQFAAWFADAVRAGLREPTAMVLATATPDGTPSARLVLLKGYDAEGFTFFTNRGSRKGVELAANPRAALVFPWHDLERQVRVEGQVSVAPHEPSAAYFATRPRGAQLGAWASRQSSVLADRRALEERTARMAERFADGPVPLPEFWGGYRVRPDAVEFWQGRADRLHDRLRYRRSGPGWLVERLAP